MRVFINDILPQALILLSQCTVLVQHNNLYNCDKSIGYETIIINYKNVYVAFYRHLKYPF